MADEDGPRIRLMRFNLVQLGRDDRAVKAAEEGMAVAVNALNAAREAYRSAVYATAYFKQIAALGGHTVVDADAKRLVLSEVNHGRLSVESIQADQPRRSYDRPNFLDPKTLNTLLTGKLLSAEEKRALLKSQGVDLDAICPPPAA